MSSGAHKQILRRVDEAEPQQLCAAVPEQPYTPRKASGQKRRTPRGAAPEEQPAAAVAVAPRLRPPALTAPPLAPPASAPAAAAASALAASAASAPAASAASALAASAATSGGRVRRRRVAAPDGGQHARDLLDAQTVQHELRASHDLGRQLDLSIN